MVDDHTSTPTRELESYEVRASLTIGGLKEIVCERRDSGEFYSRCDA